MHRVPEKARSTGAALIQKSVLVEALGFLSASELVVASCVCKPWKEAAYADTLWRRICRRRWGQVWRPWGDSDPAMETENGPIPWKRRYAIAERDATREALTKDELVRYVWRFHFKAQTLEEDPNLKQYQYVRFLARRHQNGSNATEGFLHMERGYPPMRYCLEDRKLDGKTVVRVVRVENFPDHTITRRPDWRWAIDNMHVQLVSLHEHEVPQNRGVKRNRFVYPMGA
eukprot:CAMPEP_0170178768 /NCGR_PEP_ID=MMETSP0040_2-20121228/13931_1 /TAXON_ID=641309 /ORGANISM="Lotharella oceanica, Strain CCMP622" /LENGTH=228 /DNA_ID=CAMNT_0010422239 /DNA_START=53 /DNA_END=739 /DNA_ORIENTATION=+